MCDRTRWYLFKVTLYAGLLTMWVCKIITIRRFMYAQPCMRQLIGIAWGVRVVLYMYFTNRTNGCVYLNIQTRLIVGWLFAVCLRFFLVSSFLECLPQSNRNLLSVHKQSQTHIHNHTFTEHSNMYINTSVCVCAHLLSRRMCWAQ